MMMGDLSVKVKQEIVITHEIPQCFWQIISSPWSRLLMGALISYRFYKSRPEEGDGDKGEDQLAKANKDKGLTMILLMSFKDFSFEALSTFRALFFVALPVLSRDRQTRHQEKQPSGTSSSERRHKILSPGINKPQQIKTHQPKG